LGERASFHARACSRPPEPTTITFMLYLLKKSKSGKQKRRS
jgi:hypothetical protein